MVACGVRLGGVPRSKRMAQGLMGQRDTDRPGGVFVKHRSRVQIPEVALGCKFWETLGIWGGIVGVCRAGRGAIDPVLIQWRAPRVREVCGRELSGIAGEFDHSPGVRNMVGARKTPRSLAWLITRPVVSCENASGWAGQAFAYS